MYWTTCLTSIKHQTRFQQAKMKRAHIVTVRILNERERVVGDLVDELHALMIGRVVDTTLQDAAPVPMSGDFDTISSYSVVDEL
jgi:hypothetical protein